MEDQRGLSLVEIIIVIAILSIAGGIFMMGINMVFALPARECARELKSYIEKTRIDTMGKRDTKAMLKVCLKDDGVYVTQLYEGLSPTEGGNKRVSKLCDRKVLVYWGSKSSPLAEDEKKTIFFKRETGGFADSPDFVENIWIESGTHCYKLTLHKLTGIVELERE